MLERGEGLRGFVRDGDGNAAHSAVLACVLRVRLLSLGTGKFLSLGTHRLLGATGAARGTANTANPNRQSDRMLEV